MTWVGRVFIGLLWSLLIALIAAAALMALYPAPCDDDGVAIADCDPGARDGLTIEGSR